MYLPEKFERKMQDILGDEYQEYVDCYEAPRYYGLRVNTKKISVEDFVRICPFEIRPIPWILLRWSTDLAGKASILCSGIILSAGAKCYDSGEPSAGRTG